MKTTPPRPAAASRPRVVCRLVRHWCAIAVPARSKHVAACADCQEYFQVVNALDARLRREAQLSVAAPANAPADNLEREILRAVRASGQQPRPAPQQPWKPVLLGGAAAAVLALAATFTVLDRTPTAPAGNRVAGLPANTPANTTTNPVATTVTAADAALIVEVVDSLSSTLTDSVIPAAGEMVADNPLQRELGLVYADARSALDFLALNFLPQATAASAAPTPRRTG